MEGEGGSHSLPHTHSRDTHTLSLTQEEMTMTGFQYLYQMVFIVLGTFVVGFGSLVLLIIVKSFFEDRRYKKLTKRYITS